MPFPFLSRLADGAGRLVFCLCLVLAVMVAALPVHANEDTGAPVAPEEVGHTAPPAPAPTPAPAPAPVVHTAPAHAPAVHGGPAGGPAVPAAAAKVAAPPAASAPARLTRVAAVAPGASGIPAMPAAPAAPAAPTPAPAESDGVTGQLEAMVATLEDPEARTRLVEQLRVLIAAQKGQIPDAAEDAKAEEEKPETLGAIGVALIAEQVDDLAAQAVRIGQAFSDVPLVTAWISRQIDDPSTHERWTALAMMVPPLLLAAVLIRHLGDRALSRPLAALANRRPQRIWGRLPFLFARMLLRVLPILVFMMVVYGALTVIMPGPRVRSVLYAIASASVIVQAVLLVADFLLAPAAPGLRLLRARDETAVRAYVWVRRLVVAGVYGYFLIQSAFVLGLPLAAYGALLKLLGLLIAVMLVALILQNRADVAEWLRGNPLSGNGNAHEAAERERDGQGAVMRSARRRFADVWHLFAIAYVVVAFGAWVLNVYGGFEYLARATGITIAVFLAARLLVNGLGRVLLRGIHLPAETREAYPHLEARIGLYLPLLHRLLKTVIWIVAFLAALAGWGVDTGSWVESTVGRRLVEGGTTIAITLVFAVLVWEVVSAFIERFLSGAGADGVQVERSARVRTLLPLLRNAVMILLIVMVTLITLSELGVNIAPLLAGAGVVGLAIGFGSQTLVKDVITGLFILFEDTIAVGDVVDVGGNHSGVVEAISIRTIRLRDTAGAVHSVPFSAVTTVKNMTKDFSFAVFNVSVGYNEDCDRVIEVLKRLGAEMQADPQYSFDILAPLEVMGLDKLADSGIIIMARFKTRPIKQWGIGREFNKRMKKRFDDLGITIPYPQMQLVMQGKEPKSANLEEALSQGS